MATRLAPFAALSAATLFLGACATAPYGHDAAQTSGERLSERRSPVENRPGLGTGWGERRHSAVSSSDFVRASSGPAATTRIYYNDREGIDDSTAWRHRDRRSSFDVGSLASVKLRGTGRVRSLQGYRMGGRNYMVGTDGQRYEIHVRNKTARRIEVVVSVDGLDVLDGRAASTGKRGYVIPARGSVTIEGWRRSWSSVAAFRFGAVADSYAARSAGSTRNVGVIGVAAFRERHHRPPVRHWSTGEADRRGQADPFPADSRFARPPR